VRLMQPVANITSRDSLAVSTGALEVLKVFKAHVASFGNIIMKTSRPTTQRVKYVCIVVECMLYNMLRPSVKFRSYWRKLTCVC